MISNGWNWPQFLFIRPFLFIIFTRLNLIFSIKFKMWSLDGQKFNDPIADELIPRRDEIFYQVISLSKIILIFV